MSVTPTLIIYTESGAATVVGTTGRTTANIPVQVGDFVVIWAGAESEVTNPLVLSLLGGLTGTLTVHQSDTTTGYAAAYIGSATVTSAGNLQGKVTGSSGSASMNVGVWVYRGHGGLGLTAKAHQAASSLPSLTFTVKASSAVACVTTDWSGQTGARTYRQVNSLNPTERGHFGDALTWHYDAYDYANTGAGGSITVGETAPTAQTPNTLAVEVLGLSNFTHDVAITPGSGAGVDTREVTYTLTGAVAKAATTTVTGTGTVFLSELAIGDVIRVPGGTGTESRIVSAIANDLSLTVSVAFTTTASAQTGSRVDQRQVTQESVASAVALSNVTASVADTVLLAANTDRIGMALYNESTAGLKLKYGSGASATSYTVSMGGGAYWVMPVPQYTGQINGIWSAANGAARITELTP